MNFNNLLIGSEDAERLVDVLHEAVRRAGIRGRRLHGLEARRGLDHVGPQTEVKGPNTSPGRLIWNIETEDVKGDAETFKAAGATVVGGAVELRRLPGLLDRDVRRSRRQLLPADLAHGAAARLIPLAEPRPQRFPRRISATIFTRPFRSA